MAARNPMLGFAVYFFLISILSYLAMIPISWFSRRREFAADAFSARVYGREAMISALRAIDRWVTRAQIQYSTQGARATMKIAGKAKSSMFSTHPPIAERITALQRLA